MLIPILLASGVVVWFIGTQKFDNTNEDLKNATVTKVGGGCIDMPNTAVGGCAPCESGTLVGATPFGKPLPWYKPQKHSLTADGCPKFTDARFGTCDKCGSKHAPPSTKTASDSCGCGCASGFGLQCDCGSSRTVMTREPTAPAPTSTYAPEAPSPDGGPGVYVPETPSGSGREVLIRSTEEPVFITETSQVFNEPAPSGNFVTERSEPLYQFIENRNY